MSRSKQRSKCKHSCGMCDPGKREPGVAKPSDRRRMQEDFLDDIELPSEVLLCYTCGARADWRYMPGGADYCEACVPRGCSCQDDPNEPCCEFNPIE